MTKLDYIELNLFRISCRIRCDGLVPCGSCTLRGRECEYPNSPPRKRGPKSKKELAAEAAAAAAGKAKPGSRSVSKKPGGSSQSAGPRNSSAGAPGGGGSGAKRQSMTGSKSAASMPRPSTSGRPPFPPSGAEYGNELHSSAAAAGRTSSGYGFAPGGASGPFYDDDDVAADGEEGDAQYSDGDGDDNEGGYEHDDMEEEDEGEMITIGGGLGSDDDTPLSHGGYGASASGSSNRRADIDDGANPYAKPYARTGGRRGSSGVASAAAAVGGGSETNSMGGWPVPGTLQQVGQGGGLRPSASSTSISAGLMMLSTSGGAGGASAHVGDGSGFRSGNGSRVPSVSNLHAYVHGQPVPSVSAAAPVVPLPPISIPSLNLNASTRPQRSSTVTAQVSASAAAAPGGGSVSTPLGSGFTHWPRPSERDFRAIDAYFTLVNAAIHVCDRGDFTSLLSMWGTGRSAAGLHPAMPRYWWCAHGGLEPQQMAPHSSQYDAVMESAFGGPSSSASPAVGQSYGGGGSMWRASAIDRAQFAQYHAVLACGYRTMRGRDGHPPSEGILLADAHYEKARALAFSVLDEPSHPLVAALLLLAHYCCGVIRLQTASLLASYAWRLSRACGLTVDDGGLGSACRFFRQICCNDLDPLPLSHRILPSLHHPAAGGAPSSHGHHSHHHGSDTHPHHAGKGGKGPQASPKVSRSNSSSNFAATSVAPATTGSYPASADGATAAVSRPPPFSGLTVATTVGVAIAVAEGPLSSTSAASTGSSASSNADAPSTATHAAAAAAAASSAGAAEASSAGAAAASASSSAGAADASSAGAAAAGGSISEVNGGAPASAPAPLHIGPSAASLMSTVGDDRTPVLLSDVMGAVHHSHHHRHHSHHHRHHGSSSSSHRDKAAVASSSSFYSSGDGASASGRGPSPTSGVEASLSSSASSAALLASHAHSGSSTNLAGAASAAVDAPAANAPKDAAAWAWNEGPPTHESIAQLPGNGNGSGWYDPYPTGPLPSPRASDKEGGKEQHHGHHHHSHHHRHHHSSGHHASSSSGHHQPSSSYVPSLLSKPKGEKDVDLAAAEACDAGGGVLLVHGSKDASLAVRVEEGRIVAVLAPPPQSSGAGAAAASESSFSAAASGAAAAAAAASSSSSSSSSSAYPAVTSLGDASAAPTPAPTTITAATSADGSVVVVSAHYLHTRLQEVLGYVLTRMMHMRRGMLTKAHKREVWELADELVDITSLPGVAIPTFLLATIYGIKAITCRQAGLQAAAEAWTSAAVGLWGRIPISATSHFFLTVFIARHVALIQLSSELQRRTAEIVADVSAHSGNDVRPGTASTGGGSGKGPAGDAGDARSSRGASSTTGSSRASVDGGAGAGDASTTIGLILSGETGSRYHHSSHHHHHHGSGYGGSDGVPHLPPLSDYPGFHRLARTLASVSQHWPMVARMYSGMMTEGAAMQSAACASMCRSLGVPHTSHPPPVPPQLSPRSGAGTAASFAVPEGLSTGQDESPNAGGEGGSAESSAAGGAGSRPIAGAMPPPALPIPGFRGGQYGGKRIPGLTEPAASSSSSSSHGRRSSAAAAVSSSQQQQAQRGGGAHSVSPHLGPAASPTGSSADVTGLLLGPSGPSSTAASAATPGRIAIPPAGTSGLGRQYHYCTTFLLATTPVAQDGGDEDDVEDEGGHNGGGGYGVDGGGSESRSDAEGDGVRGGGDGNDDSLGDGGDAAAAVSSEGDVHMDGYAAEGQAPSASPLDLLCMALQQLPNSSPQASPPRPSPSANDGSSSHNAGAPIAADNAAVKNHPGSVSDGSAANAGSAPHKQQQQNAASAAGDDDGNHSDGGESVTSMQSVGGSSLGGGPDSDAGSIHTGRSGALGPGGAAGAGPIAHRRPRGSSLASATDSIGMPAVPQQPAGASSSIAAPVVGEKRRRSAEYAVPSAAASGGGWAGSLGASARNPPAVRARLMRDPEFLSGAAGRGGGGNNGRQARFLPAQQQPQQQQQQPRVFTLSGFEHQLQSDQGQQSQVIAQLQLPALARHSLHGDVSAGTSPALGPLTGPSSSSSPPVTQGHNGGSNLAGVSAFPVESLQAAVAAAAAARAQASGQGGMPQLHFSHGISAGAPVVSLPPSAAFDSPQLGAQPMPSITAASSYLGTSHSGTSALNASLSVPSTLALGPGGFSQQAHNRPVPLFAGGKMVLVPPPLSPSPAAGVMIMMPSGNNSSGGGGPIPLPQQRPVLALPNDRSGASAATAAGGRPELSLVDASSGNGGGGGGIDSPGGLGTPLWGLLQGGAGNGGAVAEGSPAMMLSRPAAVAASAAAAAPAAGAAFPGHFRTRADSVLSSAGLGGGGSPRPPPQQQ